MTLIQKLLCKLGFHNWKILDFQSRQCCGCGKMQYYSFKMAKWDDR